MSLDPCSLDCHPEVKALDVGAFDGEWAVSVNVDNGRDFGVAFDGYVSFAKVGLTDACPIGATNRRFHETSGFWSKNPKFSPK